MNHHFKAAAVLLLAALLFSLLASCGGTADGTGTAASSAATTDGGKDPTEMSSNSETASSTIPEDRELRVLFLGNSLVYYNDMPLIFRDLAKAAGKKIVVDSVTVGSATMNQLASPATDIGKQARAKLTGAHWDFVIIEPSRRITPYETTIRDAEHKAAQELQALASAAGAEVLLYSVWGNNDNNINTYQMTGDTTSKTIASKPISHQEHTAIMHEANLAVSSVLGGARTVEAGYAFENFIAADNSVNLYYTDNRHPSAAGSYLVACMFYGTIYGERTADLTFTNGLDAALAAKLRSFADKTLFEGLVPDLTPPAPTAGDYHLLMIGSKLIDNYSMASVLGEIMKEADGRTLDTRSVMDGNFTFSQIRDAGNDLGVRSVLKEKQWDAIVLQLSRRNTISAADVAESETQALAKIMPELLAVTPNVFILTLNSDANPAIFEVSSVLNYSKTSKKETCSAAQGSAYFSTLAAAMADQLGCKTILYGEAYHKLTSPSKTEIGYLQACCLYSALFGKAVPDSLTYTNGLSASAAAKVRAAVQ